MAPPTASGVPLLLSRAAQDGGLRDRYQRPIEIDRRGRVWAGSVGGVLLGCLRPPPIDVVKGQVEAILRQERAYRSASSDAAPPTDLLLACAPRAHQQELRAHLSDSTQRRAGGAALCADYHQLESPPKRRSRWPSCGAARRGVGDHALTLIRSAQGMAFDLSHIFFDAIWGMSLAEIMTGFAITLYPLVRGARPVRPAQIAPLKLAATPAFLGAAQAALVDIPVEASAESNQVDLRALNQLRQRLAKIDLALHSQRSADPGALRPRRWLLSWGAGARGARRHQQAG